MQRGIVAVCRLTETKRVLKRWSEGYGLDGMEWMKDLVGKDGAKRVGYIDWVRRRESSSSAK